MKVMLRILILGFTCYAATVLAAPQGYDENAARKYIENTNDRIMNNMQLLMKGIIELADMSALILNKDGTVDGSKKVDAYIKFITTVTLLNHNIESLKEVVDEAYKFPINEFKDDEVKTGIQRMKTLISIVALGDDFEEWAQNTFDNKIFYDLKKRYCKYDSNGLDCPYKFFDLPKLIYESNNSSEILHYWNEWRNGIPDDLDKVMDIFIRLEKQLAEKMNESPTFIWFNYFLDENFGEKMEQVMSDLKPLFEEMHAYIRNRLHEEYGDVVPKYGLIPHHLYEAAKLQAWKPDTIIAKEFDGISSPIKKNFTENADEVIEIGNKFMQSLGLDKIDDDFLLRYNMDRIQDIFGICDLEVNNVGSKVYLRYCSDMNNEKFFDMHDMMAQIYYHHEEKSVPFVYTYPYSLDYAVGKAVRLSSSTANYINQVGHGSSNISTENEDMNRLFRKGVKGLLSLPENFVHVKVVTDVLNGKVSIENMNNHYWILMEKYVGVKPPVEKSKNTFDFPQEFYVAILRNQQAIKFASEIMGYQIYEGLCKNSDEYIEDDNTKALHNCNFYGNTNAGNSLKEMMKLGATKPLKKLLEIVTGDSDGMKADAILNYYKPLKKWLEIKNSENDVKIGWTQENTVISL